MGGPVYFINVYNNPIFFIFFILALYVKIIIIDLNFVKKL